MTTDTTEGMGALGAALAKAQSEFGAVTKDKTVTVTKKTGGTYSFKYAPLDQILSVVKGPLIANGLALVQLLDNEELVTMLIHKSGATLAAHTPLPSVGDVQAYGSAVTYLRRYAVQAMLGLAAEDDDDGNRATGNLAETERETTQVGNETLELLGRIQKSGVAMAGGAAGYKGEWRETPDGTHAIGFRLQLPDRDIPQVLIVGSIAEALYVGQPVIVGEQVTVKGHLFNVKQPNRKAYYRLIVGERPEDFIETADLRVPPLADPEQEAVDAIPIAEGQKALFSEAEEAAIDAALP